MKLENIISQSINENGKPIGFDVFMNFALYNPELGYYRSSSNIFGYQGDFITAPETSDLFGYSVAKQCAQIIHGSDDILEFGAGTGVLATQVLFELSRLKSLPKKYYIMELSGQLKQQQKKTIFSVLPELIDRVEWLTKLPSGFSGVVIANEVLDAIPAKRLIFSGGCFVELGVDFVDGNFQWKTLDEPYSNSSTTLPTICDEGYTTEVNLQALAWIDSLYSTMNKGTVLLIDYGMDRINITTLSVMKGLCVVIINTSPVTTPLTKSVNKILRLRLIFQISLSVLWKLVLSFRAIALNQCS